MTDIFLLSFLFVLLIGEIELYLITSFNKNYFRSGITIFKKTYFFNNKEKNWNVKISNIMEKLESVFRKIIIREIGNHHHAIRGKLLSSSFPAYHAMMHCHIDWNQDDQGYTIYGKLNHWIFLSLIYLILLLILPIFYIVDRFVLVLFALLSLTILHYLQKLKIIAIGEYIYHHLAGENT